MAARMLGYPDLPTKFRKRWRSNYVNKVITAHRIDGKEDSKPSIGVPESCMTVPTSYQIHALIKPNYSVNARRPFRSSSNDAADVNLLSSSSTC